MSRSLDVPDTSVPVTRSLRQTLGTTGILDPVAGWYLVDGERPTGVFSFQLGDLKLTKKQCRRIGDGIDYVRNDVILTISGFKKFTETMFNSRKGKGSGGLSGETFRGDETRRVSS